MIWHVKADLGGDVFANEKESQTMKSGVLGVDEVQKANDAQIRRQFEPFVRHQSCQRLVGRPNLGDLKKKSSDPLW